MQTNISNLPVNFSQKKKKKNYQPTLKHHKYLSLFIAFLSSNKYFCVFIE